MSVKAQITADKQTWWYETKLLSTTGAASTHSDTAGGSMLFYNCLHIEDVHEAADALMLSNIWVEPHRAGNKIKQQNLLNFFSYLFSRDFVPDDLSWHYRSNNLHNETQHVGTVVKAHWQSAANTHLTESNDTWLHTGGYVTLLLFKGAMWSLGEEIPMRGK